MEGIGVAFDAAFPPAVVGADQFLGVHLQVAVRVVHQPDVRRLEHQDAVVERLDSPRLDEAVSEDRSLVHLSVVVRVFEHGDPPDGVEVRFGRLEVRHELRILDHPHTAVRVPVDGNRILDEGLACHDLHVEARRQEEMLHLFFGRQHRRLVGRLLDTGRPGAVHGLLSRQGRHRAVGEQKNNQAGSSHGPLPVESPNKEQVRLRVIG